MNISFERKFVIIYVLVAMFVFAFIAITYHNNKAIADTNYSVNHTHQVLYRTEKVLSDLKDIETGVRGYILTRDTSFLSPYYQSKDSININIQKLATLTEGNAGQHSRVDTLRGFATKEYNSALIFQVCGPLISIAINCKQ